jgi:hypothetical protein
MTVVPAAISSSTRTGRSIFGISGSSLTINGNSYTLVSDIKTLAEDIASNPSGAYALAGNYDASADGLYTHAPISGTFNGIFEGLAHRIANLTVHTDGAQESAGRVESDSTPFVLRDIQLTNVDIASSQEDAGGLAGDAIYGSVVRCYSSGRVNGYVNVGGLVGFEYKGTITRSGSSASVKETEFLLAGGLVGWARESTTTESFASGPVTGSIAGGLVGQNTGTIERSYASGTVTGSRGRSTAAGGLAGISGGDGMFSKIADSYATGAVKNHGRYFTGGLVGYNAKNQSELTATSYSTGQLLGRNAQRAGGFAGFINTAQADYWDISTSGTLLGAAKGCSRKSGCQANVTGLTDEQLKSGLPSGFSPAIWGQNSSINNGYPYLLANPPPK